MTPSNCWSSYDTFDLLAETDDVSFDTELVDVCRVPVLTVILQRLDFVARKISVAFLKLNRGRNEELPKVARNSAR